MTQPQRTGRWSNEEEEALKQWMRKHPEYIDDDEDGESRRLDQSLQSSVPRAVFGRKWSQITAKLRNDILIELRMERRSQRIEALEKFKRKYLC